MKGRQQCECTDQHETVTRDLAQSVDDADGTCGGFPLCAMKLVEELGVLVVGEVERDRLRLHDTLHVVRDQVRLDRADMPEHGMQQVAEQVDGQRRRDQEDQFIDGALRRGFAARAGQVIDDELEKVERRERDAALQEP